MDALREQLQGTQVRLVAVGLLAGLIVGWLFGAYVAPPRFVDAGPQHLSDFHLHQYVEAFSDAYAVDGNGARIRQAFCYWNQRDPSAATRELDLRRATAPDQFKAKYDVVIGVLNQDGGCSQFLGTAAGDAAVDAPAAGGLGNTLGILGAVLVLLLAGAGALLWLGRRRSEPQVEGETTRTIPPRSTARGGTSRAAAAATQVAPTPRPRSSEPEITPLAGFQTTYIRGDDNFDKSFIIENANGDFLGECGVSISESIGTNGARNVTAFEIWLFDKTDTHTVTKVIMSDHAYSDDGFRAKLAPRGEPIQAREGDTIALETASLIINATLGEVEYSLDTEYPSSGFQRFTAELAAWVKSDESGGTAAATTASSADDLLEF